MALQRKAIHEYIRILPIDFQDVAGTLHAHYRAMDYSRIWDEVAAKHTEAAKTVGEGENKKEGTPFSAHEFRADMVAALVVEWDYEDNGKPVSLRPESLRKEPDRFLVEIVAAIQEDVNPNSLRDKSTSTPSGLSLVG